MSVDPGDSYHAHQKARQVYVVLRVDEGEGDLASRITVVRIHRRYEDATREVEALERKGGARHFWRVGWLGPDDGPV
ncbi:MAG TPA: hypothetical protein VFF73_09020 [Planctomycetota bacterium]|nr:hypothetical protein [Planctomycetota bacterium]